MISDNALAIKDKTSLLRLADFDKYEIFQTILFESRYYSLYVNKFNKIFVDILHDNLNSYSTFLREFVYENGCLYRKKTIACIEPLCYAESENGYIIVENKRTITIFK